MRIVITGASGLIGSALVPALRAVGHEAIALVRRPVQLPAERTWNPSAIDSKPFENADAVIHLAGRNIAAGRWSAATKAALHESRVQTTANLSQSLAAAAQRPRVLVSASAIGYYGDRGEELLREDSSSGQGFLADLSREWEGATAVAAAAGIRVVLPRIGIVLSGKGGALARMLTPFRFGLGGRLGAGRQWMSWIAVDDLVGLIMYALTTDSLRGPLNAVAPAPVTNAEFTRTLAAVLRRPAVLPVPAFALRTLLGEMAEELLLASQRVEPAAALAGGFRFRYPELRTALAHVLGSGASTSLSG